jgi:density-regulated protein DRP1
VFAKKFSCGASVVKNPSLVDEIDIQGDVKEDLVEFILEKWTQVCYSFCYSLTKFIVD